MHRAVGPGAAAQWARRRRPQLDTMHPGILAGPAHAPSHPAESAQRAQRATAQRARSGAAGPGPAAQSARMRRRPSWERMPGRRLPAWLSRASMGCRAAEEAVAALLPPTCCRETIGACAGIRPAGACAPHQSGVKSVGCGTCVP